jgi:hypothetical protein
MPEAARPDTFHISAGTQSGVDNSTTMHMREEHSSDLNLPLRQSRRHAAGISTAQNRPAAP